MSRIAVVFYPFSAKPRLELCAKALASSLAAKGLQVDLVNLKTCDNFRPAMYEYLCVGTEASGFLTSKISPVFQKALEQYTLAGKRAMAFTVKTAFFSEKVLARLMKSLESQGIYLRISGIFQDEAGAAAFGTRLDTTRKTV